MTPGWKQVAKAFGFVLLFGIIAWNLYVGAGVFNAIFRGLVAWLIFQILNIVLTNVVVRQLSEYEYKRLRQLAEEEEMEEMQQAQNNVALDEDISEASEQAKARTAAPAPETARETAPGEETASREEPASSEKEAEGEKSGDTG